MPEIVLLPIFLVIVLDTFFFLNVLCNLDVLLIHIVSLKLSALEKLVQFNRSVMLDSLQPLELQHTRPPCPSPTPRVYSNSCSLSRGSHPTVSSSVVSFSFSLLSFPASRSFQMSELFASGGQSIGVSASVFPMNIQD